MIGHWTEFRSSDQHVSKKTTSKPSYSCPICNYRDFIWFFICCISLLPHLTNTKNRKLILTFAWTTSIQCGQTCDPMWCRDPSWDNPVWWLCRPASDSFPRRYDLDRHQLHRFPHAIHRQSMFCNDKRILENTKRISKKQNKNRIMNTQKKTPQIICWCGRKHKKCFSWCLHERHEHCTAINQNVNCGLIRD